MSHSKLLTFVDGKTIPALGLGTWLSQPGEVKAAVIEAVKIGYRHLDLARIYNNQQEVGEALKEVFDSGLAKREDLFITSKLWNNSHRPDKVEAALDETLQQLGLSYLDLYLIHWPVPFKNTTVEELVPKTDDGFAILDVENVSLVDTWKALIEVKKTGKTKSIGVSNFSVEQIEGIIKATGEKPVTNQIEAHPLLPQDELKKWHDEQGIIITAYSPLGNNLKGEQRIVDYPEVQEVAKRLGADPGQVLIAYGIHRGYSVIPKSVTPSRIKANFEQITLSEHDYNEIASIFEKRTHTRFNIPFHYTPRWDINVFGEPSEKDAKLKVNIGA
ncbi:erythrose reductase 3 [Tilletiaria anomala UBC 951]|uniref:Erythrose reductase 3 n=1 Tax=Tilletiaria anomala (strain ATCC 24038 / CBS 436.72 / UBC 951) TaxID=1037660 RepID=A0A066VYB5_TILAU|nr:erythrose reductase 3 [Tilletiaria anomala UBC 951]KDN46461.1 erythrose reductase 3 [Tilletiaria anomala UBC 951]